MVQPKNCVLEDKACVECNACNICDLDETKICDNCFACLHADSDFNGIIIDDILISIEELETR